MTFIETTSRLERVTRAETSTLALHLEFARLVNNVTEDCLELGDLSRPIGYDSGIEDTGEQFGNPNILKNSTVVL